VRDAAAKDSWIDTNTLLMTAIRHELNGYAEFLSDHSFRLQASPFW